MKLASTRVRSAGVNPVGKITLLNAGMAAGADSGGLTPTTADRPDRNPRVEKLGRPAAFTRLRTEPGRNQTPDTKSDAITESVHGSRLSHSVPRRAG